MWGSPAAGASGSVTKFDTRKRSRACPAEPRSIPTGLPSAPIAQRLRIADRRLSWNATGAQQRSTLVEPGATDGSARLTTCGDSLAEAPRGPQVPRSGNSGPKRPGWRRHRVVPDPAVGLSATDVARPHRPAQGSPTARGCDDRGHAGPEDVRASRCRSVYAAVTGARQGGARWLAGAQAPQRLSHALGRRWQGPGPAQPASPTDAEPPLEHPIGDHGRTGIPAGASRRLADRATSGSSDAPGAVGPRQGVARRTVAAAQAGDDDRRHAEGTRYRPGRTLIDVCTSVVAAQLFAEDRSPPDGLWSQTLVASRLLELEVFTRLHAHGAAVAPMRRTRPRRPRGYLGTHEPRVHFMHEFVHLLAVLRR